MLGYLAFMVLFSLIRRVASVGHSSRTCLTVSSAALHLVQIVEMLPLVNRARDARVSFCEKQHLM